MVKVITSTQELIEHRSSFKAKVGYVASMGNLHAGHISLLTQALEDTETVYFSIFVNPKQFGPDDDFHKYPRTLDNDIALITQSALNYPSKSVVIYAPENTDEVFPAGYSQSVSVTEFNNIVEGSIRPGHFDGVTTVVFRLFDLIKPAIAYFGLKDYQQFLVIRQMARDLNLPIQIAGMPIMREESGLAMSSRNQYLSSGQRVESLVLNQSMREVIKLIDGKRSNLPMAQKEINALVKDPKWNYLEMRDAETLSNNITTTKRITLVGVYQLGTTRLLDNMQMEIE